MCWVWVLGVGDLLVGDLLVGDCVNTGASRVVTQMVLGHLLMFSANGQITVVNANLMSTFIF